MAENIGCNARIRKMTKIRKIENNNVNRSRYTIHNEIFLNEDKEEKIEKDDRFSKSNCGSRKKYSIETAILEKD